MADICARASSMLTPSFRRATPSRLWQLRLVSHWPDGPKRHPELDRAAQGEVERPGQHSDDRARRAIERGRLPDDIGARAEVGVPGGVADDCHARSIRHVVSVVEVAAGDRRDAERLEEARADAPAAHGNEAGRRGQREAPRVVHVEAAEDGLLALPVHEVRMRHVRVRHLPRALGDFDEPRRIVIGQGLDERGVGERVDRQRGAEPERHRDDRCDGEARAP